MAPDLRNGPTRGRAFWAGASTPRSRSAKFVGGEGRAGLEPRDVEGEGGDREAGDEVAGHEAHLHGLGAAEFGGRELADNFPVGGEDEAVVRGALGVAAIKEIEADEKIGAGVEKQRHGADLQAGGNVGEDFGEKIFARDAAEAPHGEGYEDKEERDEKEDRVKRDVDEGEDMRGSAGGGGEERNEEREAEGGGHEGRRSGAES